MTRAYKYVHTLSIVGICLALVTWSIMPSVTHSPTVLETIQDHLEQVESHGHSHGFEEDLFWAMHGHSHDVADHDHNQVFLFVSLTNNYPLLLRGPWLKVDSVAGPEGHFRIERPPRV